MSIPSCNISSCQPVTRRFGAGWTVWPLLEQQLWRCSPVSSVSRAQGADSIAGAGAECVLREDKSPHVAHRPEICGTGLPSQQHEVRLSLQDWARQGRERASNALAVQAVSCQLCVRRLLVGWPSHGLRRQYHMSMCIWRAACGIISRQAVKFNLVPATCCKGTGHRAFLPPGLGPDWASHMCCRAQAVPRPCRGCCEPPG